MIFSIKERISCCCFSILLRSLTPGIGFQFEISSPFTSINFSPSSISVFLETIQLSAISPLTKLQPFCNSNEYPSLWVSLTHISTPPRESIISSKPSKLNLTKLFIFSPVILSITADKFSALVPQPLFV